MEVRKYRIKGIVQGVGFRPFIHKIAALHQIYGWILNDSEGVLLEVEQEGFILEKFVDDILIKKPDLAEIQGIYNLKTDTVPGTYTKFEIKQSHSNTNSDILVPIDTTVCDECLSEMLDSSNRRYKYPFINCTNCGPRYSIIHNMPYDRVNTTMKSFIMCQECYNEYQDINDRRYHAQPNACENCGPKLQVQDNRGNMINKDEPLDFIVEQLKKGKIVGIKSLGGFHLAVDAFNEEALEKLRKRKRRDKKPFALMMMDKATTKKHVHLSEEEDKLLSSAQRPIVILRRKSNILPDCIAPGNPNLGIMLPSTPLHHLLFMDKKLSVLVMTSANISSEPIQYKNEEGIDKLGNIVDFMLVNDRDIHTRLDDSIVRYTSLQSADNGFNSFIRIGRGYSPLTINTNEELKEIIAVGSELKNTVAMSKNNKIYISQHIGDLKNNETFSSHIECSEKMQDLFEISPTIIACDMHPNFVSTIKALKQKKIPFYKIQHHHAHMASCMAENNMIGEVIGVIFDGNGYGTDGKMWGGEFLVGGYTNFRRAGKLRNINLIGGDKATKEPYRIAFDLLMQSTQLELDELKKYFFSEVPDDRINFLNAMYTKKLNTYETSSAGRLFDGISALLNVCTEIQYEAQAAIELESLLNANNTRCESYKFDIKHTNDLFEVDFRTMIIDILEDILNKEEPKHIISRKFHSTMVQIILDTVKLISKDTKLNRVVLSGGVFGNNFLLSNTINALRNEEFEVFYHTKVPCNDGGISLGQVMIANYKSKK
jgi:hydrogenase maturation protein HypF